MPLTNFDSTTPVTASYLNDLINRLPRTAVLARSSKESEASTGSASFVELARLKLRPMQGDYLHLSFETKAGVLGGTVRTLLEFTGAQLGIQNDTTTSASFGVVNRSINMASVGGNDLTCEDVDLVFYGKVAAIGATAIVLRSIWVASSDQASPASVGQ